MDISTSPKPRGGLRIQELDSAVEDSLLSYGSPAPKLT